MSRCSHVINRLCDARGQATIEFGGMALYLLLGALFCWQMGLIAWTAVSTDNAVRTASRLVSRGVSDTKAIQQGRDSLAGKFLFDHSSLRIVTDSATGGQEAVADVQIPFLFPGLHSGVPIHAHAELPSTG